MWPDRSASAPNTAIVMTASTTPYSAIVWPVSLSLRFRRSSRSKNFSIGSPPFEGEGTPQGAPAVDVGRANEERLDGAADVRRGHRCLLGAVVRGVAAPPLRLSIRISPR